MIITSKDNPKIKELMKLSKKSEREEKKCFIVEGEHLVREAREKGVLIEAYSIEEKEGYQALSIDVMKKLCHTDTVVKEIGLCKMLNSKTLSNKLLILDKIQDPGNLGALMRSAYAFGFDTIILNHGSVDIYNDKVIRTSQGAIFKLNFRYEDLKTFIPTLTSYKVYGTNVINGISLDDAVFDDKVALVLGNEGNGISDEVFNVIQKNIYIPLKNTESLNVSVAGAIIMYEMSKKA